jgi:hypothetical protein
MALSEWIDITPSEWMDRVLPGWKSSYGDMMNTRPSEWWQRMYGLGVSRPMAYTRKSRRHHGHHHHPRKSHHHGHCRRCGSDPCECYCCIGDVDLAVYTRVGEQRVIQLVIENERHREKEVSLEFSEWTTRGGKKAPVETAFLEPKKFTLPPCAEQSVTLVVKISGADETEAKELREAEEVESSKRVRIPDVDDCLVATADLRLVGCDHRPLRIAVAILPRDCDPYRVTCDCNCC